MIILALLVMLLQTPTASIEGVVVDAGSNEPIPNARVILTRNDATPVALIAGRAAASTSMSTNSEGRFAFKGIEPGTYRLLLEANGYVRQEYGQRSFPGNGSPIRLSAGETRKDVASRMTPTGTINGRILNEEGRPLAGVQVRLLRYSYSSEGYRALRQFGVAQTDERGEYRAFYVTPGSYYVSAGSAQGPGGYGEATLGPNQLRQTYTYRYYPGVAELSVATPIEVRPGATRFAIDLTLVKQLMYRVRGRVVDAGTGRPPEKPTLSLHFQDAGTGLDYSIPAGGADLDRSATYQEGTFEFRGVVPGTYYMSASEVINSPPNRQSRRTGTAPVQVNSSDVDGIVVTIPAGFSIPGRMRVEGSDTLANASLLGRPQVTLRRSAGNSSGSSVLDLFAEVAADGTFRMDGATPGPYRIAVSLNSRFYIKEARYGLTDVLNPGFDFTGRDSHNIEIVLSPNVATVDGIVTNNRGEPAAAAQVVLVPERFRDRAELFTSATTDQNGRFTISAAAPGDYKVFAWEAIEPNSWFDPDVLRRDEQTGKPIRLAESSSTVIDLKLIPSR